MSAENVQVEVTAVEVTAVEVPAVEAPVEVKEEKPADAVVAEEPAVKVDEKVETFGVEPETADASEKKVEEKRLSTRMHGLFGFCLACGKPEEEEAKKEEEAAPASQKDLPQEGETEKENIAVGVPAAEVVVQAEETPVETPAPAAEEAPAVEAQ